MLALFLRSHLWLALRMLVRIKARPTDVSIDGISLSRFRMGCVYSLPVSLATLMVVEGWAVPVLDSGHFTLPEISFTLLPRPERRRRTMTTRGLNKLGIAADRRRRRN